MIKQIGILLLTTFLLGSCMDDEQWYSMNEIDLENNRLAANYIQQQSGLFIINEGNFMYDNSSLSYYMIDSMKVLNNVFQRTNKLPLGDVAQSLFVRDSLAYIVLNNSGKIYIIDLNTFQLQGKITGLSSPREMLFLSDSKAYVSDLYAQQISIIDPGSQKITGYIPVKNTVSEFGQHATESMLMVGNEVFVNCWSFDNKILVIDPYDDVLIDSIEVPLQPNSMVLDQDSMLWVLCDGGYEGNPFGHEAASLVCIDPAKREIAQRINFTKEDHPGKLTINGTGDTLYFINKDIYHYPVNGNQPAEIIISSNYDNYTQGGYYGLAKDPYSCDLYIADAVDQVQRGRIYRFKASGVAIDTFFAGINPGYFCFKAE